MKGVDALPNAGIVSYRDQNTWKWSLMNKNEIIKYKIMMHWKMKLQLTANMRLEVPNVSIVHVLSI